MRASVAGSLLIGALVLALPGAAPAQSPELDRVEELSRLGRTEEARAALTEWWEGARDDAAREDLQRGLWLRGRLTVDPGQAELDYQRLVVLYPSGSYAPRALLRLAQAAYARGDGEGARRHLEALRRDYPVSSSREEAEAWMSTAGPLPVRVEEPTVQPSDTALGAVAPRVAADTLRAPETTPAPVGTPVGDAVGGIRPSAGRRPAPADAVLDWSIQFGAFSDENRAFALQRELVSEGLAARLVRVEGSGFLHVRIGRFGSRQEASGQLEEITRRGFTAAIVQDDRAEEVVRR